tara:strand:- start:871 stop:1284 length:414 start_codon:yes stop_codon:yes gene_type:complete
MQILTIAGNCGKDAELRNTQGGDPVLNFSLAVDNGKDRDGNKRPATWYDCSVWGKRATALQSYITKGSKLTISGRPTVRVHDGKAYLGVNVDQLTFMGGGEGGQRQGGDSGGYGRPTSGGYSDKGAIGSDFDDEVPF